jgi:hypothetical protein
MNQSQSNRVVVFRPELSHNRSSMRFDCRTIDE